MPFGGDLVVMTGWAVAKALPVQGARWLIFFSPYLLFLMFSLLLVWFILVAASYCDSYYCIALHLLKCQIYSTTSLCCRDRLFLLIGSIVLSFLVLKQSSQMGALLIL